MSYPILQPLIDKLAPLGDAIENWPVSQAIAQGASLFPWLESIHVLAISLVVGTVAIVDLRLLGLTSQRWRCSKLIREALPITWGAFVVAMVTGTLLFMSHPGRYLAIGWFISKMLIILAAFVNMLVFHFTAEKHIADWDDKVVVVPQARIAGALSIAMWILVVACGRVIGFSY